MRRAGPATVAVLASLTLAHDAGATTARVDVPDATPEARNTLVVAAAGGEENRIAIDFDRSADEWIVRDDGAPLTAGTGCTPQDDGSVRCHVISSDDSRFAALARVHAVVDAGDGNDRIDAVLSHNTMTLKGGPGDDQIATAPDPSATWSLYLPDRLTFSDSGPSWSWNSPTLDGGPGADVIDNRVRSVAISYIGRLRGVNVSLDGIANDGEPGEGDNLLGDYVGVEGTNFDDTIKVTRGGSYIEGAGGFDAIEGSDGPDVINTGSGGGIVRAGDGDDKVTLDALRGDFSGGNGSDVIAPRSSWRATGQPHFLISLDRLSNDGYVLGGLSTQANVHPDFENVSAGFGDLYGGPAGETLSGGNVSGGAGDDFVNAASAGTGGPGRDIILANRAVFARDGEVDSTACGLDWPVVLDLDPIDNAPGCTPLPKLASTPSRRPDRRGYFAVRVTCAGPAQSACLGKIRLRSFDRTRVLDPEAPVVAYASGALGHIPGGATKTVRLRVTARFRSQLRRGKRVKGDVVTEAPFAGPAGTRLVALGPLKLLTPRR
jgi:hypothetical protein